MKRRRRLFLSTAAIGILVVLAFLVWPGEQEPVHQGKKLSEWLTIYSEAATPDAIPDAATAVHAIGTNGVPVVLRWINYQTPKWRTHLANWAARHLPRFLQRRFLWKQIAGSKEIRADESIKYFEILRDKAAPAVPALSNLLSRVDSRDTFTRAMNALIFIGEKGVVPLVSAVTNKQMKLEYRNSAVFSLGPVYEKGTNSTLMFRTLTQCLQDEDIAANIVIILGQFTEDADRVIPALRDCLREQNINARIHATEALGSFGPAAEEALPDLMKMMTGESVLARQAATNALRKIAPQILKEMEP